MEYLWPFMQMAQKHGMVVAIVGVIALACVGVVAYYAKARIEVYRSESTLQQNERQAVVNELSQARTQMFNLVSIHSNTMQGVFKEVSAQNQACVDALREIVTDLKAHRDESSSRHETIKDKIASLSIQVAGH